MGCHVKGRNTWDLQEDQQELCLGKDSRLCPSWGQNTFALMICCKSWIQHFCLLSDHFPSPVLLKEGRRKTSSVEREKEIGNQILKYFLKRQFDQKLCTYSCQNKKNLFLKFKAFSEVTKFFLWYFLQFYKGMLHKWTLEIFSSVVNKHSPWAWCQRGAMVTPHRVQPVWCRAENSPVISAVWECIYTRRALILSGAAETQLLWKAIFYIHQSLGKLVGSLCRCRVPWALLKRKEQVRGEAKIAKRFNSFLCFNLHKNIRQ